MPNDFDAAHHTQARRYGTAWLTVAIGGALLVACQTTPQPAPAPPARPATIDVPPQAPVEAPVAASASASAPVPVRDAVPVETPAEALANLLGYAERLRSMGASERKQELMAQNNQVSRPVAGAASGASPRAQMQLALALLQTREPLENARALALLQRVAASNDPEARTYTALAHVLIDTLVNTRRLEDNLERTSQQLRESQRRIDMLNDRLDAMRAIERSLNAPPSPPRPIGP